MVDKLHEMRELQIKIGKQYGSVEKDWYAVDPAFHRVINNRKRHDYIAKCGNEEEAIKRMEAYLKQITDPKVDGGYCFDTTKAKMKRSREKENKKLTAEGKPTKSLEITDEGVRAEIEKQIPITARAWITKNYDMQDSANYMEGDKLKNIGRLNPFGIRLAVDTSKKAKVGEETISFDDLLRDYDIDTQLDRNYHRFAGETAFLQRFKTQEEWDEHIKEVDRTYAELVRENKITKKEAESERKAYIDMMNEVRGMRTIEDGYEKSRAFAGLLRAITYIVRGTNMGFNQLGELGGAITFGGGKQLLRLMPFVGKHLENLNYKDIDGEKLERTACQMIAMDAGEYMLKDNPFNVTLNEVFNGTSKGHKFMRGVGEAVNLMAKGTSFVNRLPYMTHTMLSGLCKDAIYQCLLKAHGKTNRRIEHMFSEKNLKFLGIQDTESFLKNIRKYTVYDENGMMKDLDIRKWQEEDHKTYSQFYTMVIRHTEKGLLQNDSIGGRNITLKDMHPFLQLVFQFKDFSMRALNGQTLRAYTNRDIMEGQAIVFSSISSTLSLALRSYIPYYTYLRLGEEKKAKEYHKKYCQPDDLLWQGVLRSVYLSPASLGFDMWEVISGQEINRRTTTSYKKEELDTDNLFTSIIPRLVEQAPSADMVDDILKVGATIPNAYPDGYNKEDVEAFLAITPWRNYIPFSAFIDTLINRNLKY